MYFAHKRTLNIFNDFDNQF